jgi:RNase H-like domain found in reverse transcriptase
VTNSSGQGAQPSSRFLRNIWNTIARQVLLKYPDVTKPCDVYTDSSNFQLGAVISQNDWPIACYSRKLNSAQQNYTTKEKELLSIVETSQQYRHILLNNHCNFYCDHENLGLVIIKSERVHRWCAILEEFDYSFIYCPGKENTIADMLSCYPTTTVDTSDYKELTTVRDNIFPATTDKLQASQCVTTDLHHKVLSNANATLKHNGVNLIYCNGFFCRSYPRLVSH